MAEGRVSDVGAAAVAVRWLWGVRVGGSGSSLQKATVGAGGSSLQKANGRTGRCDRPFGREHQWSQGTAPAAGGGGERKRCPHTA